MDKTNWKYYPNDANSIKQHVKLVLSSISTEDLIEELAIREQVK